MSPEGFSPGPEGDFEKANLQKVSLEIQNLIHAQDFDAARSLLDSLEDSGRKQQLETIFSLEKMRRERQRREEEEEKVEQEKTKEGQGLTLGEHGLTREDAQYILDDVRRRQEKDFEENKKLLESLQEEKAKIDERISERDKKIEALDKKISEREKELEDFTKDEQKDLQEAPFGGVITEKPREIAQVEVVSSESVHGEPHTRQLTEQFEVLDERFSPDEQKRLREQLGKQFAEAEREAVAKEGEPFKKEKSVREEAYEKTGHALKDPEKLKVVWDKVGEWVEGALVPSEKKQALTAILFDIQKYLGAIQEKKGTDEGPSADARNLNRSIESFLHLMHSVESKDRSKTFSDEDNREMERLMQNVQSYEFDVKKGQYDHVKGGKPLSMEDTQEIPIPESEEEDLESTQEIPASVVEEVPQTQERDVSSLETLEDTEKQKETNKLRDEIKELEKGGQEALKRFGYAGGSASAERAGFIEQEILKREQEIRQIEAARLSSDDVQDQEQPPPLTETPNEDEKQERAGKLKKEIAELNEAVRRQTVMRQYGEHGGFDREKTYAYVEAEIAKREAELRKLEEAKVRDQNNEEIRSLRAEIDEMNRIVQKGEAMQRFGKEYGFNKEETYNYIEGKVRENEERIRKLEQPAGVQTGERKEVLEAIAALPEKERPSFTRRILGAGLFVQEKKNAAFAGVYSWASKKYGEEGALGRFLGAAKENYTKAREASHAQKDALLENKTGAWRTGGELMRSAALIARATDPFRWFSPLRSVAASLMFVGRYGEIMQGARMKNEEALAEKTRIEDEDEAMQEAVELYWSMGKSLKEDTASAEELSAAYLEALPKQIADRLESAGSAALLANLGVRISVDKIFKEQQKLFAEREQGMDESQYQEKMNELLSKNRARLEYFDKVVSKAGTMDFIAEAGRRAGVWSKRIATVLAIETALESLSNLLESAPVFGEGAQEHELSAGGVEQIPTEHNVPVVAEMTPEHGEAALEVPEVVTIEQGGNIWSSAHEAAEKAGLSKGQFAEAWGNSTVTLPDGREIPIAELNLVHEGDTLSYVPGEDGEVGHFEFHNASDIPYGDAVALPGAEEIHSDDFEQQEWAEPQTADIEAEAIEPLPIEHSANSAIPQTEHEYEPYRGGNEAPPLPPESGETLEAQVAWEFDRDMRAVFGGNNPENSEWQQWKAMPVKKFMGYRFEHGTPANLLHKYVEHIMKDSKLRPIGGLFRREETMEAYVRRALFIIVSKERKG